MNIAQIENNISNLINNFSKENYIYDLLLAYGIPKNTITLLKKGKRNLSKRDDQLILKKKILFQEVISEDPHLIIDLIANEKESYRHDPRFIIVTNYKELLAIDTKTKETLDIDVKDFDKNFVFFLPLAGMEKTQHKNENPADVKAAEKMAKIYDEILKENDCADAAGKRRRCTGAPPRQAVASEPAPPGWRRRAARTGKIDVFMD
ncbi:TPA: type IIL restriction-modification enzyme MmeI [Legionella anisa]|nr:hypothetical protein [Legionella pneumophila]HEK3761936.1 hypothetical protein [Legionella pneumophila]HEK3768004.1 hypothetical protein [Legionella pneumophila]HEK3774101.1 hypothetical protein [Legionella pneumophila]HEK3777235.1 hypothetical protein [Legionella pneumophila]